MTTPIENILRESDYQMGDDCTRWMQDYSAFCQTLPWPRNLISLHQEKLGKPTRVKMFFRKFWIWERSDWTVLVNKDKGICFEVPESHSKAQAWEAWKSYKKEMGVP